VTSDGGFSGESVSNSPDNGDKTGPAGMLHWHNYVDILLLLFLYVFWGFKARHFVLLNSCSSVQQTEYQLQLLVIKHLFALRNLMVIKVSKIWCQTHFLFDCI